MINKYLYIEYNRNSIYLQNINVLCKVLKLLTLNLDLDLDFSKIRKKLNIEIKTDILNFLFNIIKVIYKSNDPHYTNNDPHYSLLINKVNLLIKLQINIYYILYPDNQSNKETDLYKYNVNNITKIGQGVSFDDEINELFDDEIVKLLLINNNDTINKYEKNNNITISSLNNLNNFKKYINIKYSKNILEFIKSLMHIVNIVKFHKMDICECISIKSLKYNNNQREIPLKDNKDLMFCKYSCENKTNYKFNANPKYLYYFLNNYFD